MECIDAVYVILDHRGDPDRLMETYAWLDYDRAEARAHEIREHYREHGGHCPVESVEVVRLSVIDFAEFSVMKDSLESISTARKCVSDLCAGRKQWVMSVPVDEDRDPDVVIGSALREADAEIRRLRDTVANLEGRLQERRKMTKPV